MKNYTTDNIVNFSLAGHASSGKTTFAESLAFCSGTINKVGTIAEVEGHHPDIVFGWGYATVKIFTHKIKGLVESDFILAAKIDKI